MRSTGRAREYDYDDDHDGDMDCADSDCAGATQCGEIDCADGIDNDADGNIDCTDSECYGDSTCQFYSFDGVYSMNVVLSDSNVSTDDCIGTISLTMTTDGYNHADVVGTGTCASTQLGIIALNFDGYSFQTNGVTANIGGLITHTNNSNENFYGNVQSGNLVETSSGITIQMAWQTSLPITGVLLPTNGVATY